MNRYKGYLYRKFKNFIYYYKNKNKIFLQEKEYNRLSKFSQNEKKKEKTIFNGHEISFLSPFWFLHSVDEIFVEEVYKFKAESDHPVILDCGANIGLSLVYFKKLYPNAHIIAF